MSATRTIALYALRESMRRRVFAVVLVLTVVFLVLYALGADQAFDEAGSFGGPEAILVDPVTVVGATMLGLATFAILFLGAVLATFLTLGAVRGDAERGLLQPIVVRPLGRTALLAGRFAGAAGVSALYVAVVFVVAALLTEAVGGWSPDRLVVPALELGAAVAIVTALSLVGSVFLSATANGIAVLMAYGAGLTAGLLGQIGEALDSATLETISRVATWALPFEGLYQDALHQLTAETTGFTQTALSLGPFGGAQAAGPGLWAWSVVYLGLLGALAVRGFTRRDL